MMSCWTTTTSAVTLYSGSESCGCHFLSASAYKDKPMHKWEMRVCDRMDVGLAHSCMCVFLISISCFCNATTPLACWYWLIRFWTAPDVGAFSLSRKGLLIMLLSSVSVYNQQHWVTWWRLFALPHTHWHWTENIPQLAVCMSGLS